MSVVNVVGGGLMLLGLLYLFALILVPFLHTPRIAKFVLAFLCLGSAVAAGGTGLTVYLGGEGPLGFATAEWAAGFVVAQLIGVGLFDAVLGYYVVLRRW